MNGADSEPRRQLPTTAAREITASQPKRRQLCVEYGGLLEIVFYWNVPCWGHQLWDINCCMCVCVCVSQCICPPTYRYIAPRMIQRIILKLCGYVGCDDATNVSNFGYEPIKFSSLKLIK